MSQDSPSGRRLGPYSSLSTFLQRFVSGEDIVIADVNPSSCKNDVYGKVFAVVPRFASYSFSFTPWERYRLADSVAYFSGAP